MTREQAIDGYRRATALEQRMSARLRQEILIPFFGGCCCRQHNCRVNWEAGLIETPGNPLEHNRLAELSKRYDYEQAKVWAETGRLKAYFARFF